MPKKYLEYLFSMPIELEDIISKNPIAYVPFGALEWHGRHNILGVDSVKATEICKRAVEKTGGVLFPCVNYGAFHTMRFPFTLRSPKAPYKRMTKKLVEQLYVMGFRIIILLSGHYPTKQISQIGRVARKISKKHKDCFALGIPEHFLIPDFGYFGDHAASWETSIMMAINPKMVDLSLIPDRLNFAERARIHGILGKDPKIHASLEKGIEVIDTIVYRLSEVVIKVVNSNSFEPFHQIYQKYNEIRKQQKGIKQLFKIHGIDSKKEGWDYLTWMVLKRGRYDPKYKFHKKN